MIVFFVETILLVPRLGVRRSPTPRLGYCQDKQPGHQHPGCKPADMSPERHRGKVRHLREQA
jgi:hypothetical protein